MMSKWVCDEKFVNAITLCDLMGDALIPSILVIWLLLLKQKRMWFKPIKSRLFCWTGGQEQ